MLFLAFMLGKDLVRLLGVIQAGFHISPLNINYDVGAACPETTNE
jgi:hypothetical protein